MPYVFPVQKYLSTIGLSKELELAPTKAFLDLIMEHHVRYIPYQNFEIFHSAESRNKIKLNPEALVEDMLHKQKGGMCYQHSELLFHALSTLRYDVHRFPAIVTLRSPYHPGKLSDHNLLLATVDGQIYLLDVGFGYNSVRAPLPITLDTSAEVDLNGYERYQWICAGDHFQLNAWIESQWLPFYCLSAPLVSIGAEETRQNFFKLCHSSDVIPIRDTVIKAGILTKDGRTAFHSEPFREKFLAYRMDIQKDNIKKFYFSDMASFARDIKQSLGLEIPATMPGYSDLSG